MVNNKFFKVYSFYLMANSKINEIKSIDELTEFYNWFFDFNKKNHIRLWQSSYWKKKRIELIKQKKVCSICGSDKNLVLQHTKPYPGRFLLLSQVYGLIKRDTFIHFRKLRKKYDYPSKEFIFPYYINYLKIYFNEIFDYIFFKHVDIYCKKCAFKSDILFTPPLKRYFSIDFSKIIYDFYKEKTCEFATTEDGRLRPPAGGSK
jgi:hypothetical protein